MVGIEERKLEEVKQKDGKSRETLESKIEKKIINKGICQDGFSYSSSVGYVGIYTIPQKQVLLKSTCVAFFRRLLISKFPL